MKAFIPFIPSRKPRPLKWRGTAKGYSILYLLGAW